MRWDGPGMGQMGTDGDGGRVQLQWGHGSMPRWDGSRLGGIVVGGLEYVEAWSKGGGGGVIALFAATGRTWSEMRYGDGWREWSEEW